MSRTFRIFVSSTFSDLKEERNALQKYVFPRLRELCARHGCRFQAIDLRWGVREEAGLDQRTMNICLEEIKRSQQTSPKPNFIVLLGDRYGWRPLPAEIPQREFEHICANTYGNQEIQLLETWYRRDDNACYRRSKAAKPESIYCLQPRRRGEPFADFHIWEDEVERPLRAVLLRAAQNLELTMDERRRYEASATEQEIAAGALQVPDAASHVFCSFRNIRNLPADASARDFMDLDSTGAPDIAAGEKLRGLKALLEATLVGNIHHYEADWIGGAPSIRHIGSLPEDPAACRALLDDPNASGTLCVDVWTRLAPLIEREMAQIEQIDAIDRESADHLAFAENRARIFVGRGPMLRRISGYIEGPECRPLAIWGESGSGKSSLMAKAMAECMVRSQDCHVVARFIGATPESYDGRSLLESICRQIARRCGGDEAAVPTDYKDLAIAFGEQLKLATAQNPLIVFLDALDQLSFVDYARNLRWLPPELPEHARVVVSMLPGECKSALERKLPDSSFAKLEPMPAAEADELLDTWLAEAGRTLQPSQKREVLGKFALSAAAAGNASGMPLYLKLAFEEARRWQSYAPAADLNSDISGIIRQLFERLSSAANHGVTIVSRSLGYLGAAKNGLTEDELLDVLSLDEDVRADFQARARHTPPGNLLPVVVWSRLYFDLASYLTERNADGASLIHFYHRQLQEVIEAEFLAGDDKPVRHAHLASYFMRQSLFDPHSGIPNLRKLSELPYQQTYSRLWNELADTLTDFDFLEAKCAHAGIPPAKSAGVKTIRGGVYQLQEDFRRALEIAP